MMTVLRVHESIVIKGGSEIYIRNIIDELNKRNILNIFLVIEEVKSHYNIYIDRKLICKARKKKLTNTLTEILTEYSIDIVHIHGIANPGAVRYFLNHFKVVRTMHEPRLVCPGYSKFWVTCGLPCKKRYGLHCFFHAFSQKCFRSRMPLNILKSYLNTEFEVKEAAPKYKAIFVMSEYMKTEAVKGGILEEKIILNLHFTKFKLPLNIFEGGDKHFLFVGRLIAHKGITCLLNAISEVLNHHGEIYLDIVGDGILYDDINNFIQTKHLEKKITLEKWKSPEEISRLMKNSYCVLFPSIYPEAFGQVGIEAAMHSKPVIAFNSGGVSTWLVNNYNGYLIDEISVQSLYESIEKLIELLPLQYQAMSKNAWEYANLHFTPEKHIEKLISVYEKCMKL